jgi:hypothetical protein
MNTPITGRIYHIVDKLTGRAIKVGSTTRRIEQRFGQSDYRKKYTHHKIVEVKQIQSTDLDWYDPKDAYCPFLWHLVASEHIEMLRVGSYRSTPLSNMISPLLQKYRSKFGLSEFSSQGGRKGGRSNVVSGHLRSISSKGGKSGDGVAKRRNGLDLLKQKRGVFAPGIASLGGLIGGPKAGRIAVESGQLARLRTSEHQSIASKTANHNRWHVKRNIKNPECKLCQGINNGTDVLQ